MGAVGLATCVPGEKTGAFVAVDRFFPLHVGLGAYVSVILRRKELDASFGAEWTG